MDPHLAKLFRNLTDDKVARVHAALAAARDLASAGDFAGAAAELRSVEGEASLIAGEFQVLARSLRR